MYNTLRDGIVYFEGGDNDQDYDNMLYTPGKFCCRYAIIDDVFSHHTGNWHSTTASVDTIKHSQIINLRYGD